jgi:hypothetical protein
MSFITQGLGAGASTARLLLLGFFAGEPFIPTVLGARGVAPGEGLEDNPPRRVNVAQGRRAVMAVARRTNTASDGRRN